MKKKVLKLLGMSIIASVMAATLGSGVFAAGKTVGYKEANNIQGYLTKNTDVAEKISKQSWLFAHASVGENMLGGMRALSSSTPSLYKLSVKATNESSPANKSNGIYDLSRGNPGFMAKVTMFEGYIKDRGWSSKVDIAMNKHCYIDALYDYNRSASSNRSLAVSNAKKYLSSMASLEKRFPNTAFVYVTMPLTISGEAKDNYVRHYYNKKIRDYCKKNKKYLLDIANIESRYENGKKSSVKVNGVTVEALINAYASDNGHLNQKGQERLAKGWYAMAALISKK